jgi:hypothetical protein
LQLTATLKINGATNTNPVDAMLVESVSETFREVFSQGISVAFYDYLYRQFSISRNMIPERVDEFESALSETFGQSASLVLTKAIAKRLYLRAGVQFAEKPSYGLLRYVRDLQVILENRQVGT